MGGKMYYSLSDHLKTLFGCKVYKLALSGGMTCPNRDGTLGTRGCIFCSQKGSGDFAETKCDNITQQIENAKRRVEGKIKNGKFIAYFQDFTNTYAPTEHLERIFLEAINHPDIVALSIATRPDCLPKNVLNLLERLNKIKPVWVELGLQTVHPASTVYIRRGYDINVFDEAVKNLKSIGVEVIVHMIVGLPNETDEMIFETAGYIGQSGADGIKIHLLHILEGTDLADDYKKGKFQLPTLEKYTELVLGCLKRIPKTMVVHRLTGDGAKRDLIAPLWSADKKKVLNYISSEIRKSNLRQGELFD